jgi:hypothetical protein
MEEQLNAITHRYAVHFKQHVTPVDVPKLEKLAASLGSRSIHLRKCAVAAGIASLIAFIAGATISGSVLICFRP